MANPRMVENGVSDRGSPSPSTASTFTTRCSSRILPSDDLKLGDEQGRRLMFPQVLGIVRRYVETRLEFMGAAAPEEIALGKYRSTIESRVVRRPVAGASRHGRSRINWHRALPHVAPRLVLRDASGVRSHDPTA